MCECPRKVGIVGSLTGQWQILAERCITFPKPHPPPPARVTIPQVQGKGGRWDAIQASSPCRRSSKHLSPAVGRQSWGCLSVGGMQASKHLWTGMLRWRGLVIGKMICLPITAAMEGQKGGGGGPKGWRAAPRWMLLCLGEDRDKEWDTCCLGKHVRRLGPCWRGARDREA